MTKVKIPEFVAEWVEECKADGEVSILTNSYLTPSQIDKWLEKSDSNYELIYNAYVNGYEILEEKYYAKIKGWDKVKKLDGSQGDDVYWNYYESEGVLLVNNKVNMTLFQTTLTITRWNELGIDQSNAVFEEA